MAVWACVAPANKIETDRQRLRQEMARIRKDLAAMKTVREIKRARRKAGHLPRIAIVGYTNAGKSSLLNALTGAGVLVEDALFATILIPPPACAQLRDGRHGHHYRHCGVCTPPAHAAHCRPSWPTLEEVLESDVILHVVDGSESLPAGAD